MQELIFLDDKKREKKKRKKKQSKKMSRFQAIATNRNSLKNVYPHCIASRGIGESRLQDRANDA